MGSAPAAAAPVASAAPTAVAGDNRLLSPVVRRLVNEHGLAPDAITGTGPGGRITRDDVLDHIDATGAVPQVAAVPTAVPESPAPATQVGTAQPPAPAPVPSVPAPPARTTVPPVPAPPARTTAPAAAAGERDSIVPLSKIRSLTGDHMVMSKATSPHAFSVVEVDYANVDVVRTAAKSQWKSTHGFSLTYLPFIARALIDGLRRVPAPQRQCRRASTSSCTTSSTSASPSTSTTRGCLAPVIRDAETKRLAALAAEISDLADRARSRKLSPDEISGGTFTITNNGSAGSVLTMPIINQPQVAIISTDAIVRKPVVTRGSDGGEAIAIHPVGNLAMSWDHRAFDGAYAAGFLRRVKEILETKDWSTEL